MDEAPRPFEILSASVPDFTDDAAALTWVRHQARVIKSIELSALARDDVFSFTATEACVQNASGTPDASCLGRFGLAMLLADWACYADPATKEAYPHLRQALSAFPLGFRLWMLPYRENASIPVGYTGWHPIPESVFAALRDSPGQFTNRAQITPIRSLGPDRNYVYIFNISIISQLHKTTASKLLIKTLAADLKRQKISGLAVITVSPDGQRIAERFGLRPTGSITHEGQEEEAFAGDIAE